MRLHLLSFLNVWLVHLTEFILSTISFETFEMIINTDDDILLILFSKCRLILICSLFWSINEFVVLFIIRKSYASGLPEMSKIPISSFVLIHGPNISSLQALSSTANLIWSIVLSVCSLISISLYRLPEGCGFTFFRPILDFHFDFCNVERLSILSCRFLSLPLAWCYRERFRCFKLVALCFESLYNAVIDRKSVV